jgi:hypothetical protein
MTITPNKTTLIFFGNIENSKYGTLRSTIAIVLVIIVLLMLKQFNEVLYESIIERKFGLFLAIVVIVSAICVQVPANRYDAIKYGMSVGIVLSVIAAVAWSPKFNMSNVGFILGSGITTSLISLIVYEMSRNLGWYPFKHC